MMRLRRHFSYANVMSTIALFAVLGGGAYAASKIGPQDIKRNAVKSRHIAPEAVKRPDTHVKLRLKCAAGADYFGGFCIEKSARNADDFFDAFNDCRLESKRLPTVGELALYRSEPGVTLAGGVNGEWTSEFYTEGADVLAQVVNEEGGQSPVDADAGSLSYRCARAPKR